ncbi:unnamed protein product [Jaminaea pallidilutea]
MSAPMSVGSPSSPSWRSTQAQQRARLRGPFTSVEDILGLLLPTCKLLDLLHDHEDEHDGDLSSYFQPEEPIYGVDVSCLSEAEQEQWRQAFCSEAWLGDLQNAILGPIAADWSEELRKVRGGRVWEALLRLFFLPSSERRSRNASKPMIVTVDDEGQSTVQEEKRRIAAACVTASGLQSVSQALANVSALPPTTTSTAVMNHAQNPVLLTSLRISCLYTSQPFLLRRPMEAASAQNNVAKRNLAWQEAVKVLTSLPVRVANAVRDSRPEVTFDSHAYSANLYQQYAGLALATDAKATDSWQASALAVLLTRMVRAGAINELPQSADELSSPRFFWTALLQTALRESLDERAKRSWLAILGHLDSRDRSQVSLRLPIYLDAAINRLVGPCQDAQGTSSVVVTAKEKSQPARVGQRFLSKEVAAFTSLSAAVCGHFQLETGSSSIGDGDDEKDSDDEEDSMQEFISNVIFRASSAPLWSPLMARIFVQQFSTSTAALQTLLQHTIRQWADQSRIRRCSTEEELFIVTLLICTLTALRHSGCTDCGRTTSRSRAFVEGVGAHLDSLQPYIRRLGMLAAEIVSELHFDEQQIAEGGSGAAFKKLQFGSSAWDGMGEGREEARVLRALYHAWPTLTDEGMMSFNKLSIAERLQALGLAANEGSRGRAQETHGAVAGSVVPQREGLRTRMLPERISAAEQRGTRHTNAGRSSSLIVDMDVDSSLNTQGPQIESDTESSSSDSDSSDEEETAGKPSAKKTTSQPRSGITPLDDDTTEESPFELEPASKKRRGPPVYIYDLGTLLRETPQDRDAIRLALKHGASLVRRKSRFARGEIDENAADLVFAFAGLQNNFAIKAFEERRTAALQALLSASPSVATPVLIEQFFVANYSLAQRVSMLNALARAARELSGHSVEDGTGAVQKQTQGLVDDLSNMAISRARKEGESRAPEIRKEQAVKVTSQRGIRKNPGAGIQELSTDGFEAIARKGAIVNRADERYVNVAGSLFVFPFVNRLLSNIQEASSRMSRLGGLSAGYSSSVGSTTARQPPASAIGWSSTSLFEPFLLAAILDTLAVLVYEARNALDFLAVIAPEVMEAALVVVGVALPLSKAFSGGGSSTQQDSAGEQRGGDSTDKVAGSALSLILIILDASYELDSGTQLLRNRRQLLDDVGRLASEVFEQQDARARKTTAMGRAGRCSAAVILRLEEIRQNGREQMMRTM